MSRRPARNLTSFTRKWCFTSLGLVAAILLAGTACGSDTRGAGSICTPNSSVEAEECTLDQDDKGFFATSQQDIREICNSPCTRVDSLHIEGVSGLEDLGALSRLKYIGHLYLRRNPQLKTTEGIGVEGEMKSLNVVNNDSLRDLSGFRNVTAIDGGGLEVYDNASLRSLSGLDNLELIKSTQGWSMNIGSNRLASLKPLDNARIAGRGVTIHYENHLRTLDGLPDVGTVYTVSVSTNAKLESIEALAGVEKVIQSLEIYQNESLPRCHIDAVVDQIDTSSERLNIHIMSNASGDCE